MAVELMVGAYNTTTNNFGAIMEENAVREATAAGLESVEKLIQLLSQNSHNNHHTTTQLDKPSSQDSYKEVADLAVNKFRKVISLLDRTRTGHARFRRGPLNPSPPTNKLGILDSSNKGSHVSAFKRVYSCSHSQSQSQIQRLPPLPQSSNNHVQVQHSLVPKLIERKECSTTINFSGSKSNSYVSSLTGDSISESVQPCSMSSGFQITNMSSQVSVSGGKPPLSSSMKRKCVSLDDSKCGAGQSSGRCHCPKRRKSKNKRVVIVRVPAISLKMADIPPDDYTWRKYGQKPIKGSPHPRNYYRCSSVRGCPARKHVERALDDASMLIVTYDNDHSHPISVTDATVAASLVLESS